jgi:hypothetical protein
MLPDNPTSIDYLRDVISNQLDLPEDRVNIYNQKFNIPNDSHLFVGIEYKFSKTFGAKSETFEDEGVFNEHQGLNLQEHYSVMLFSRNTEALTRRYEVVAALGSVYARQQGDRYGFQIARIAQIQDLSSLEGAAILYRMEIPIVMLCRYEKIKSIPWYGTFPGQVTVSNGTDGVASFDPTLPT